MENSILQLKKLSFKNFTKPFELSKKSNDNFYRVYIGNGRAEIFSSEKAAKQFLSKINEDFNQYYYETNTIFTSVICLQRQFHLYLNDVSSQYIIQYFQLENQLFFLSDSVNKHSHIISKLKGMIYTIINICKCLNVLFEAKNYYQNLYTVQSYMKQCNRLIDTIDNYCLSDS